MSAVPSFLSRPSLVMLGSLLSWVPIVIGFNHYVGRPMRVTGSSMYPFLNKEYSNSLEKDIVWVSTLSPLRAIHRGDIVAFWTPANPEIVAVKRIIAVEGDQVMTRHPYPFAKENVPIGHVWVEGDNPDATKTRDSNAYGAISKNLIIGKVKAILYPFSKAGLINWQDYRGSPRVVENKIPIIPRDPRVEANRG